MVPLKGMGLPQLPDTFVANCNQQALTEKLSNLPERVSYQKWKRVTVTFKTSDGELKETKKLRIVTEEDDRESFKTSLLEETDVMKAHVSRVHAQYNACRFLKDSLTLTACTVQMDLSENWVITYPNEPQFVYFCKEPITLLPAVLHFRSQNNTFHESLAIVTDDRRHDAGAVYAFMKVIVAFIRERHPQIEMIHYLTDGPSSQYRNVSCISLLTKHKDIFDLLALF